MYDVVRIKKGEPFLLAAVRGIQHDPLSQANLYTLRTLDGRTAKILEYELEPTGRFEAPLQYQEVVDVWPREAKYAHLSGKRGVVEGISVNDETGEWFFGIALQTGEVWFFSAEEVQSIGCSLPQDITNIQETQLLSIRVDAVTGEGTLVDGDPSIDIHQYVPYPINLDDL